MDLMQTDTYPALEALRARLDATEGQLTAADADIGIATLREFLADGAKLGRGLRDDVARFRPTDEVGRALCYLFIVTIDAATHRNREAPLQAYAAGNQPLAAEAGELYAMLTDPAFGQATGPRPVVSKRTDGKGCGAH